MYKRYFYIFFLIILNSIGMEQPSATPCFADSKQPVSPTLAGLPRVVKMDLLYRLAQDEFEKKDGKLATVVKDIRSLFFTCKAYAQFMYDDDATGWLIAHLIPVAGKKWRGKITEGDYGHYETLDAAVALRTVAAGRNLVRCLNTSDDEKQMKRDRWAADEIFWRYLMSNKLRSSAKVAYLKMLYNAGCYPEAGTFGVTPLMVAIERADPPLAAFLFERGVDLTLSTVNSDTAEDMLKHLKTQAIKSKDQGKINSLIAIEDMLKKYEAAHPQIVQKKSEKCIVE